MDVGIVLKEDQASGYLTYGKVVQILTKSATHPHGIKVRLSTGEVGRVNPKQYNRNHQTSSGHCAMCIHKKSSLNLWVKLKFFINTQNTSTATNFGNPITWFGLKSLFK